MIQSSLGILLCIFFPIIVSSTSPELQDPWLLSGRCGKNHLLPNGKPGQCDPKANADQKGPCCSSEGWCGNSQRHCNCKGCQDFRDFGGKNIRIDVMVDDHFTLYDGSPENMNRKIGSGPGPWNKVFTFSTPLTTEYLTIKAQNRGGPAHIILSTSDGTLTNANWKCKINDGSPIKDIHNWENAKVLQDKNLNRKAISPMAKYIWITANGRAPPGTSGKHGIICYTKRSIKGTQWMKVFSHDARAGLFKDNNDALSKNPSNPSAAMFSILNQLENFRLKDGTFHLKLCYPEIKDYQTPCNEWTQTSNPAQKSDIEGYHPIQITFKSNSGYSRFEGLGVNSVSSGAFIDDTPKKGYWYFAVGAKKHFYSPNDNKPAHSSKKTIPGPYYHNPWNVHKVELFAEIGEVWIALPTGHYQFLTTNMMYDEAKTSCENNGGKMIEIDSEKEQKAIIEYIQSQPDLKKNHFWLGVTDKSADGTWASESSGKPIIYKNWASGEPDGGRRENCAVQIKLSRSSSGGKWADVSCRRQDAYSICEKGSPHWNGKCVIDNKGGKRILGGFSILKQSDMSPGKCISLCRKKGFNYAGVQFGAECFCGNTAPPTSDLAPAGDCKMPCTGDSSQICGAANRMNVYSTSDVATTPEPPSGNQSGNGGYGGVSTTKSCRGSKLDCYFLPTNNEGGEFTVNKYNDCFKKCCMDPKCKSFDFGAKWGNGYNCGIQYITRKAQKLVPAEKCQWSYTELI